MHIIAKSSPISSFWKYSKGEKIRLLRPDQIGHDILKIVIKTQSETVFHPKKGKSKEQGSLNQKVAAGKM